MSARVLFIGDSRRMRGGVSTVMRTFEQSPLWEMWHCGWLETQVNAGKATKVLYLLKGMIKGLFTIPRNRICHFQTTPGTGMLTLLPIFLYAVLWRRKIVVQLHMGNQIKGHVNDWTFKLWSRHSDCFIFLGKTWEDEIRLFLPKQLRTEYLYNPIGNIDVNASRLEEAREPFFLFTAFFNPNKGYDVLLTAFSRVVKYYPDWRLVMCGTGDVEPVLRQIKALGIEKNVDMPGWVEGEKKERLFRTASAYCMTSYQEGLPMSVLESMACGLPVISTPVGCLPELLTDNESVLFFDFGNADELERCMMRVIKDDIMCRRIVEEAQGIAQEKFSVESVTSKLNMIYQSL